ncbi:MAG: transporter [Kordiimonadaceae bacterium]|jgi:Na+/H+ antiporter NhaC|nr:transporter [Kordiimonadaceae bacterium]MBT6032997.1 transporter [Kordiimonadaceae bacterium]
METVINYGVWSLVPLVFSLVTAFWTRSAIFSLFAGCLIGVLMLGFDPSASFMGLDPAGGLVRLFAASLDGEFIRICVIIIFIGILFELFKRAGVLLAFANKVSKTGTSPKKVKFTTWLMGFFIVDDYFSPLMTGPIMRPLTDGARVSREKLAFILDSTTASVCVLVPFMSWGAYIGGLIAKEGGPINGADEAIGLFAASIPYNIYPMLLIIFTMLICLEIIPDFGFMKKAETRAREEGKVLRDGAIPMVSDEGGDIFEQKFEKAYLLWDFAIPIIIVFGTVGVTYFMFGSLMILEAFIMAVIYLGTSLYVKKYVKDFSDLTEIGVTGAKSVMSAIIITALAYSINTVTKGLGAAEFIMVFSEDFMTPQLLVATTFFITAVISFSTGTSWGAFALMIPFVLPIAYGFSGGVAHDPIVYKALAAVVGGGIFGDHSSPVSDTSVLSSIGAGSDHMDHVITQLPYALVVGSTTIAIYLVI